jgi:ketosteroid isomerase-like protein
MSSDRKAVASIRAADAAWLKAYQAKDVGKSVGFFDEQGSMLVPNSPILTGKDAIAKFIARGFALQDYQITWHPNQAGVAVSGDLGYTSGTYTMSFKDVSGKTISDTGKYLMVWKKQPDGEWKVLFDTSNSDSPRR